MKIAQAEAALANHNKDHLAPADPPKIPYNLQATNTQIHKKYKYK